MVPEFVGNFIDGAFREAADGKTFEKRSPHSGHLLTRAARSGPDDVQAAVDACQRARSAWSGMTWVARGDLMREVAAVMMDRKVEIAGIVAAETGKAPAHALDETRAAVEMGMFVAGEGRRNYGRTMGAAMAHRQVFTVRQPLGTAALVIAANTPIANVAWKAFPSMFCGNASILKPSEDTPATAWVFADICRQAGIPPGVFNVVQGLGPEAGQALVSHPAVDLVSFTGGHETGRRVQTTAGARLAKVCLELGGKNALVVCDDADPDTAEKWVLASAFSNAGQRCAAASRIIIFDGIYDRFRDRLVAATRQLTMGPEDSDFLGPVINERQLNHMLTAVTEARTAGARVLTGGGRSTLTGLGAGWYMEPTILENVAPDAPISRNELFGPITILYRVQNLEEAVALANNSSFGLTAAIHTASVHRAMAFAEQVQAGVVVVNGGTHGSEPHMGFGGLKNSGTGWREAGVEALDVYSDLKYINLITDPKRV